MWWGTFILLFSYALAATHRPHVKPTTKAPIETATEDEYYDTDDDTPIPPTSFSCDNRRDGFYADVETGCRVFHYCQTIQSAGTAEEIKDWAFVCPPTTIFRQQYLTCSPADGSFKCEDSEQYFNATEKPSTPATPPPLLPAPTSLPLPSSSPQPTNAPSSTFQPSSSPQPSTSSSTSAPSATTPLPPVQTQATLQLDDSYLLPPLLESFPLGTFRPIGDSIPIIPFTSDYMPKEVFDHFKHHEIKPEFYIKGMKLDDVQTLDEYLKKLAWPKK